ncbi:MAG: caspase family protein [Saprospiraceae bacterium]|nr:caspase family protein [Saprospiraceae bacterium]
MKIPVLSAVTLLLCLHILTEVQSQDNVRALLIGVGDYPPESGWNPLSAANDLTLLKTVLTDNQVPADNIRTLLDADATRAGIENALGELAASARAGETVWVHFSGHGQQVQDDNGDELDGLDEALVPYDAPKKWKKNEYEGERHLRDEKLGEKLAEVRLRVGKKGRLVITVDACHSGTGTRGFGNARGTDEVMADPDWLRTLTGRALPLKDAALESTTALPEDAAPWVLLSSSAPHELSFETSGPDGAATGLFTAALAQALAQAAPDDTYETLFVQVRRQMMGVTTQQTPQLEGDPQLRIGGGRFRVPVGCSSVKSVIDSAYVSLPCGRLQGLMPGMQVVFFPPELADTAGVTPIATGIVEVGDWYTCDVALFQSAAPDLLATARVWKQSAGEPFAPATLRVDLPPGALRDTLLVRMAASACVRLAGSGQTPDLIVGGANPVWLRAADGRELFRSTGAPDADALASTILTRTRDHLFAAHLRTLDWVDPLLKARVELVDMDGATPIPERTFSPGRKVRVRVENAGSEPFYFSMLYVPASDSLELLVPFDRPAQEYRLEPGRQYVSEFYFETATGEGPAILKVLLSPEPLPWSWLEAGRGEAPDAGFTRALYPDALREARSQGQSRGNDHLPGSGSIISLIFETKN